eukprot:gnl/Hemi2/25273_TR8509_c0_g1_i1.p2 gnl/Hemi2/25273_TR8509_c0_g1~~gnl/Hemi2/25273_TR8509_c0_g1_i1.p2  ORF type:complete len:149 (-),score=56.49 gnl/Hemi2/25273_TR8509_c0_g1_i1:162-608(-)
MATHDSCIPEHAKNEYTPGKNPYHQNMIYEQYIRRSRVPASQLTDNFQPINLAMVTEKPNKEMNITRTEAIDKAFNKIKNRTREPVVKYRFPLTTTQDIGWAASMAPRKPNKYCYFPKKSCPETKFADLYTTTTHNNVATGKPFTGIC